MGVSDVQSDAQKLTDALKNGAKPDLRSLGNFIFEKLNPIRSDEWEVLAAEICRVYGFASESELAQHIKRPLFTSSGSFEDEFRPVLDSIQLKGWLGQYIEHCRNMEAPSIYHFASGLIVLSAALQRQVYVEQGYFKIWPATRAILVGPSGLGKSTAAGYAVGLGSASKRVHQLSNEGSIEGLKSELAELAQRKGDAAALLYISELSAAIDDKDYTAKFVKGLTDLFDDNSIRRRTVARNFEEIKNPAVSFLACSNPEWLNDLPKSAFAGGFLARILLWWAPGTDRCEPWPKLPSNDEADMLRIELLKTQFIRGEILPGRGAEAFFSERYKEIKKTRPQDERLNPFWERLPNHMLRMGMLLAVSEKMEQKPLLEEKHLHQADEILKWLSARLPQVYSHLGLTPFSREQQRIIALLQRSGGSIGEAELGRKLRMSNRLLEEHMQTLEQYKVVIRRPSVAEWDGKWQARLLRKSEEI